jgi:hypothetical protein
MGSVALKHAAHAMHSFQLNSLVMKYTSSAKIIQPLPLLDREPNQGLPVSFDMLLAELHRNREALNHEDDPSAFK